MEKVVWQDIFHKKLEDKPHAVEVFKNHIEEVKRFVPENRLLVFEARQGWEPLCAFLDVPAPPNQPFPHKNKGRMVRLIFQYRTLLQWVALAAITTLLLLLVRAIVT